MSEPRRTISIEENAQYLLNSNSDLKRDADISKAVIYENVTTKYKRGYQPLLTPHTPHSANNDEYFLHSFQDEDILLNPNQHKSTMSIGGESNSFDNDNNSEPRPTDHHQLSPPQINITPLLSSHDRKHSSYYMKNNINSGWSTSNWTSIFLHFHSVDRDYYIYPLVMIIGMIFIFAIMFMELFIVPPSSFVFCRYLNWVLLILFCYMFAFVISYSKVSTKRWCLIRDYLYIIFWVNSLISLLIGIGMKCVPFLKNNIEDKLKYVNCSNNDYQCTRYKDKYNLTELEMDIFIVISHTMPFIYCIAISLMFSHKDSFQKWCKEICLLILVAIFWCFWNIFSYIVTGKWTYKGIDEMYKKHNGDQVILPMLAILMVILCIMFIIYWICWVLHHHCTLCQHNYSKYLKPKALAAKFKEKERELKDMPDIDDAFESGIAL